MRGRSEGCGACVLRVSPCGLHIFFLFSNVPGWPEIRRKSARGKNCILSQLARSKYGAQKFVRRSNGRLVLLQVVFRNRNRRWLFVTIARPIRCVLSKDKVDLTLSMNRYGSPIDGVQFPDEPWWAIDRGNQIGIIHPSFFHPHPIHSPSPFFRKSISRLFAGFRFIVSTNTSLYP